MRIMLIFLSLLWAAVSTAQAAEKLIVKQSPHTVSVTLDRLTEILKEKGITVFTRVDHAEGAKKAGLELKPTQLLIFGNPKLGTPLMQANRNIGIDLPLKALAWQDDDGKVWLGYTDPASLKERFAVEGHDEVFKKMTGALDMFTTAAIAAQ